MYTIYKYPLNTGDIDLKEGDTTIELDEDCANPTVLHVGLDPSNKLCAWIRLEKHKGYLLRPEQRKVRIAIRGTGHDCSDVATWTHITTINDGPYMWHVFTDQRRR